MLFGWFAGAPMKLGMPSGLCIFDLFLIGCVAAIGFTVSLFIATVAFDPGPVQDAAEMGALPSYFAAAISLVVGKLSKREKQHGQA